MGSESAITATGVSNLTKMLGALGDITLLKNLTSQVFNIRSQFQDIESEMTVFLGSAEKAQAHVQELLDYAYYNIFEFKDLTAASSQLLAFGNDVNEVIPIIDKLSNIASGTKQPLGDLVALYNNAKNIGEVDAMGLQQWARQGIVITDVLAEMGVQVDRSAIKFEHLEMVLNKVTSEGGRYHNFMASQMENLSASYGQLQNNLSVMFNEIGKKLQDPMKKAIDIAGILVDNYEKIGRVLIGLVATYGVYRTAIVLVNSVKAAQKAIYAANTVALMPNTTATKVLTAAIWKQVAAQLGLNAAMNVNPAMLIATALAALGTALWALRDRTTEAERAQKRHNNTLKEAKDRKDALISKGNELISTLQSETTTVYQQVEAYRELLALLPQLEGKSMAEIMQMDGAELARLLNEQADKQNKKTREKDYRDALAQAEEWKKIRKNAIRSGGSGRVQGAKVEYYENLAKEIKAEIDKIADIEREAFLLANPEVQKREWEQAKAKLIAESEALQAQLKGDWTDITLNVQIRAKESLIQDTNAKLQSLDRVYENSITQNKPYWENIKKEAEDALAAIGIDSVGSDDWNKYTEQINEANKALESWNDRRRENATSGKDPNDELQK
jgi:hypothetical protein